jgi:hypothetical protein
MEDAMTMDRVLGVGNGANWGDIIVEAVYIRSSNKSNTFSMCLFYSITCPGHMGRPNQAEAKLAHGVGMGSVCWV